MAISSIVLQITKQGKKTSNDKCRMDNLISIRENREHQGLSIMSSFKAFHQTGKPAKKVKHNFKNHAVTLTIQSKAVNKTGDNTFQSKYEPIETIAE
ncbi:hypothetical protein COLO4_06054 [Corchorus olitorius]|uniref:Uncharacterized protein n=1 Tax=Corchorus olitorius TaxID=93759 RepID=A0A1R3KP44_9ROSI|nr:hypothetical protein COLO4_06054 [Corchorus olitorius]